MGPSSGKDQQCGSHAKLSRHRVVDTHTCVQRAHKGMRTVRSIRDQRYKEFTPLLDGFSTLEAFFGPKAQPLINKTTNNVVNSAVKCFVRKQAAPTKIHTALCRGVLRGSGGTQHMSVMLMSLNEYCTTVC